MYKGINVDKVAMKRKEETNVLPNQALILYKGLMHRVQCDCNSKKNIEVLSFIIYCEYIFGKSFIIENK
jgi:hypothetical protein